MLDFIVSNLWPVFLIVLFFGGSIFVHELGHFLAARKRGLVVQRFSIGFGPKIFSWTRNGVEYRLSWLPLGGYVALPQLADMAGIEGESDKPREQLPPLTYADKMIVSVMGAVFNVIFAFLLACLIWVVGKPTSETAQSTSVGYVVPSFVLADGTEVVSPAQQANLQKGDRIVSIDGKPVNQFTDIPQHLATGTGRDQDGQPMARFVIERDGKLLEKTINPRLYGDERLRQIGMAPAHTVVVGGLIRDLPAQAAGVQTGDVMVAIDGEKVFSWAQVQTHIQENADRDIEFTFEREGEFYTVALTPGQREFRAGQQVADIGVQPASKSIILHPNPVEQVTDVITMTFSVLGALLNPASDLGPRHLAGPAGIARFFHAASTIDWRLAVWVAVLVNINLAILNLLPLPVLDGGHMLYATIAKLRGKPLPSSFVAATQSMFIILLLMFMVYVTFHDISRWVRDAGQERSYIAPQMVDEEQANE
jgi:regulator of sigma E protease